MSTADDPDKMLTAAAVGRARRKMMSLAGKTIETPHYVAVTSRGVVPHLSPDVLSKHTSISAAYFGLEDCECFVLFASVMSLTTSLPVYG